MRANLRAPVSKSRFRNHFNGQLCYSSSGVGSSLSHEEHIADVRRYFICCPLCGSPKITPHLINGGRDTLYCDSCGARWHLYVGLTGLKWAELELESDTGTGRELLGKRIQKEQWKNMAHEARRRHPHDVMPPPLPQHTTIKEKETIIKEIVMIPCKYCGALMPQTSTFCPNCGARRK